MTHGEARAVGVCVHGGLRRTCSTCVADRLDAAEQRLADVTRELGDLVALRTRERDEARSAAGRPCWCCEQGRKNEGHPPFCQPGCGCWGTCDDPCCCEPDQ